ncbi:MAG: restriction endonuclease [Acidobacteriaceae bacterium]|nr:restriction endonuclease [Acidobacteriaceae bacterium]
MVTLTQFSDAALQWFDEEPERLKLLSPEQFQNLIADRLEQMGLGVQLVGNVFRKDGGIDIVAYPRQDRCNFPFLLAVQAKHHRTSRKTEVQDVREFHGALRCGLPNFNMGLLVTNTSFTADADWLARNTGTLVRLRDLKDLRRWIRNDFVNESEWREIPEQIVLAPDVTITIPKPKKPQIIPNPKIF